MGPKQQVGEAVSPNKMVSQGLFLIGEAGLEQYALPPASMLLLAY